MNKIILFLDFTGHQDTPCVATKTDFIRRVSYYTPVVDPINAEEIRNACIDLMSQADQDIVDASNGGDSIIIALPGITLMAAAVMYHLISRFRGKLGVVSAVKINNNYIFDCSDDHVLWFNRKRPVSST